MPTYTYACTECAERFEAVQSIHDSALTDCPACGGAVRRVISAVGVSFKGSGFYRTDSRSAAKSEGASKGSDSKGDSGKSGAKSDGGGGSSGATSAPSKDSGSSTSVAAKSSGSSGAGSSSA